MGFRIRRSLQLVLIVTLATIGILSTQIVSSDTASANSVWPRPVIVPIPDSVTGVANSKVLLNGTWKFTTNVPTNFWSNTVDPSNWSNAIVPGDLAVQGFTINRDVEYPYKKEISIPADFSGKKILLRLEGGYDYARVWVNGNFVRDHEGAFTTWDCDITNYVTPGQTATVTIGLTARNADTAVEYRHSRGLVRDVSLIALPKDNLTRLHFDTLFDSTYTNSTLNVSAAMEFGVANSGTINLKLQDPLGNPVAISPSSINLTSASPEATVNIPVSAPVKWDQEHPNLYKLTAQVTVGGSVVETVSNNVGFRSVKWVGKDMFVNGQRIVLRGVNWHQTNPTLGLTSNNANDEESLRKLKAANINMIRTAHFPQTEYVLDLCDKLGLYVESENSVFFIGSQGVAPGSSSDPAFTSRYVNQLSEMVERDRSHPSIIMWSIGNESTEWGSNFQKEYDYIKAEDPSRPIIFSYEWDSTLQDISSWHYPDVNNSMTGTYNRPLFLEEYAHINYFGDNDGAYMKTDPSVRDFYGEELKYIWEKMYKAPTNLGGAIWMSNDATYYGANGPVYRDSDHRGSLYDWGILDVWNREKPEWWNVKKAYSPVVINENKKEVLNPGTGNPLSIPIQNRYNHTNLNQIQFKWTVGTSTGSVTGPDMAPGGSKGFLVLPSRSWVDGDVVNVKVYNGTEYVDEYNFTLGSRVIKFPGPQGTAPAVTSDTSNYYVNGSNFSITFSKTTGMVSSADYNGSNILTGGPYLNLGNSNLGAWTFTSINHSATVGSEAVMTIVGKYGGTLNCTFTVKIDGSGLITTSYALSGTMPTTLSGGLSEVGVGYDVVNTADRISWKRNGTWSAYPLDYIAKNEGTASKVKVTGSDTYLAKPQWAWSQDEKDYFQFGINDTGGRGTNEFRASKRNVYFASLILAGSNKRVKMEGDGEGSARASINPNGTIRFNMNNEWAGMTQGWGAGSNITKKISVSSGYSNTVKMRLTDNDNYTETSNALTSIIAPAPIEAVIGSAKTAAALGLPQQVGLITEAALGSTNADVTWDLSGISYDPVVKTAQAFTVPGTVTLPNGLENPNNVPLTTSINVTVDKIPSTQMTATATSQETDGEDNSASMAIDGDPTTIWHTKWDESDPLPQSITLNLAGTYKINKLTYLPRESGSNGIITAYNIYVSTDGVTFTKVASGNWAIDNEEKNVAFTSINASYVKLEATAGVNGWASAAEIGVSIEPLTMPHTVISGADKVTSGQTFEVTMGISNVTQSVYQQMNAQDLTLHYDPAKLQFESVTSSKDGFQVIDQKESAPGQIRIVAASVGANQGVPAQGDLLAFKFKAKSLSQATNTTISGGSVVIANGQGNELQVGGSSREIQISIPSTPVDKSLLNASIANAQAKYDAAVEGNGDGLYATGSKAQLQSAINTAHATANDPNATQQQVDSAKAVLEAAIQVFDSKKITANVNGDGSISIGDLAIVAGAYGKQPGQAGWNDKADVNHDGKVDIEDLAIVAKAILQ